MYVGVWENMIVLTSECGFRRTSNNRRLKHKYDIIMLSTLSDKKNEKYIWNLYCPYI